MPHPVLAVVEDLFFSVKINEAAKRAGLAVQFVKSQADALGQAAAQRPELIILDLNFNAVDPIGLIQQLKAGETRSISLLGYLSHVQGELKQKAQEAGCDVVLARSAFSQNLPQIFRRYSGQVA
jgi:CheY-like chemotaxis protein